MLAEVRDVQENYATQFPELKGKSLELAGFVWFQGLEWVHTGSDRPYH